MTTGCGARIESADTASCRSCQSTFICFRPGAPDEWQPASEDLAALGDAGRAFVSRLFEGFTVSNAAEGAILLEAGHSVDALSAIRGLSMDGKTVPEINAFQRLEIAWSRQLASLLAQLRTMQSKNYAEPRRCPGCRHRRCYSGAWTADDRLAGRFE